MPLQQIVCRHHRAWNTPSGMTSVVSTVAGGLETPDFLELRKGRSGSEAVESSEPRSFYQVVPEIQTSVCGLMRSERGYDVSAVAGAPITILGDKRGTKVRYFSCFKDGHSDIIIISARRTEWMCLWMLESWEVCQRRNYARITTAMRDNGGVPFSAHFHPKHFNITWTPTWFNLQELHRHKPTGG